jgi:hypothetical protein
VETDYQEPELFGRFSVLVLPMELVLVILALACMASIAVCDEECKIYLAPNKYGYGRGVYAGVNTLLNDYPIAYSPTLLVRSNHLWDTGRITSTLSNSLTHSPTHSPTYSLTRLLTYLLTHSGLNNYVFGSEDERYSMVAFGPSLLMNHRNNNTATEHYWDEDDIPSASQSTIEPYSTYSTISFKALRNVEVGEEITTTYGDQEWFTSRGIPEVSAIVDQNVESSSSSSSSYLLDELKSIGKCLSDVYIAPSTIAMAGKGVYASRNFDIGEIVSISPVLLISKDKLAATVKDSVLINYCYAHPDSDIFILPLHLTALINHHYHSNVNVSWYNNKIWKEAMNTGHIDVESTPVEYIVDLSFAALDVQYIATRPIADIEEIFLNYSEVWINTWAEYLAKRIQAHTDKLQVFRHPIYMEGLYPALWVLPQSEVVVEII